MRSKACLIALALCLSGPAAASECKWQLKHVQPAPKGGGIVCHPRQPDFQTAMLTCEAAPLHLDLEGDCGAGKAACRVRFLLDLEEFHLVGGNHPTRQIWNGFIEIPLLGQRGFLEALAKAKHVAVSVEGEPPRSMPTRGLAETVKTLAVSCKARTSRADPASAAGGELFQTGAV